MTNDNQAALDPKSEAEDKKALEEQKAKDKKLPENDKDRLDEALDQAGKESFPSSDPVSVKITK